MFSTLYNDWEVGLHASQFPKYQAIAASTFRNGFALRHTVTRCIYIIVCLFLSLSLGLREFEAKRIAINRSRFAVVVSTTTTTAVVVMAVVLVPKPLKTIHNLRAHILYSVRIVLSVALIRINKNFPFSFGSRLPRAYDKERI